MLTNLALVTGTDDDLPPPYQNSRGMKGSGRISGNGREVGAGPYTRVQPQTDMETQIHQLEQEAYCSVLRAFKAQSDAITWEKEGLITELRKELRVSDKEHRELLNRVNNDDIIQRIREWRESTGGLQMNLVNNAQHSHDPMPSPTTSARKRQKISQPIPSASVPAPSVLHSQPLTAPMQPSSSGAKKAAPPGTKGKKTKPGQKLPGAPAVKSMPSSVGPGGRGSIMNRNISGGLPPEGLRLDPLIGRKVLTRWPDDNNFYEAVITNYDPGKGHYELVYDMDTAHETWEWVDFKQDYERRTSTVYQVLELGSKSPGLVLCCLMAPEDIRWEDEDPGINQQGHGAPVHGGKKSSSRGGPMSGAGRGRGPQKNSCRKDFPPSQNGVGKKSSNYIEILHTETLIKEVDCVFSAGNPDPLEMERAKKVLKEHEQSLVDAIARLAEASDAESDDRARSLEYNRGWRNEHGGRYPDDMAIDGLMAGDADAL
ncbi:protein EMSY-LIKE 3-like isoform X2 [Phragmites australis]|uniref:protein EMSY-LIKE 3-like isoform X2 n=1 Tax=Phragmites australis TaxID=29695 RepID=UPI002D797DAA|nr:protein EMSY-LIKE 3-like isoform X2 [Phragmites australis]